MTIAESSLISSPMAVGLWSPKVLLPASFESNFSAEDRENILRHEIAHLDRFDDWLNLAQQLCIAFVPVNPFLWILRKRLRLQKEIACDDWALAGANHPKNYANLLARLAAAHQRGPLLASGVSRSGRQLYQRVSRILDKNSNRGSQSIVAKHPVSGTQCSWCYGRSSGLVPRHNVDRSCASDRGPEYAGFPRRQTRGPEFRRNHVTEEFCPQRCRRRSPARGGECTGYCAGR
jgi:hypothetical protein